MPSGNSVAAMVLQTLASLSGEKEWQEAGDRQLDSVRGAGDEDISDYRQRGEDHHSLRHPAGNWLPADDVVFFQLMKDDSVLVRREGLRGKEKVPPGSGRDASLIAFLESLDEKQRYSALVHLSVLWAQRHDKNAGRDRE